MSKRVATIILNRNLPDITDKLHSHIKLYDGNHTDIFVVEAGSSPDNLSKSCTWYVNDKVALEQGLRYSRGMNYALDRLYKSGLYFDYEFFFLLTNDTELNCSSTLAPLVSVMDNHDRLGILSPCDETWGERNLIPDNDVRYFWFIHNNAYLLRRSFLDQIVNPESWLYFLFDGSNFRGYCSELELIAKAYANEWSAGITTSAFASENESYLLNQSDLIKTDPYHQNLSLYISEGLEWLRAKYGFNSHWLMQEYAKSFYDRFFVIHSNLLPYKI